MRNTSQRRAPQAHNAKPVARGRPKGTYQRVGYTSITCPQCQAPPGEACRRADGQPSSSSAQWTHVARRRMATRAYNEAQATQGTLLPIPEET